MISITADNNVFTVINTDKNRLTQENSENQRLLEQIENAEPAANITRKSNGSLAKEDERISEPMLKKDRKAQEIFKHRVNTDSPNRSESRPVILKRKKAIIYSVITTLSFITGGLFTLYNMRKNGHASGTPCTVDTDAAVTIDEPYLHTLLPQHYLNERAGQSAFPEQSSFLPVHHQRVRRELSEPVQMELVSDAELNKIINQQQVIDIDRFLSETSPHRLAYLEQQDEATLKIMRINDIIDLIKCPENKIKNIRNIARTILKSRNEYGSLYNENITKHRSEEIINDWLTRHLFLTDNDNDNDFIQSIIKEIKSEVNSPLYNSYIQRNILDKLNESHNKIRLSSKSRTYFRNKIIRPKIPSILFKSNDEEEGILRQTLVSSPEWGLFNAGLLHFNLQKLNPEDYTIDDIINIGVKYIYLKKENPDDVMIASLFNTASEIYSVLNSDGNSQVQNPGNHNVSSRIDNYVNYIYEYLEAKNPITIYNKALENWHPKDHFKDNPEKLFKEQNEDLAKKSIIPDQIAMYEAITLLREEDRNYIKNANVELLRPWYSEPRVRNMAMRVIPTEEIYPAIYNEVLSCDNGNDKRNYAISRYENGEYFIAKYNNEDELLEYLFQPEIMKKIKAAKSTDSPYRLYFYSYNNSIVKTKEQNIEAMVENIANKHEKILCDQLQTEGYEASDFEKYMSSSTLYRCITGKTGTGVYKLQSRISDCMDTVATFASGFMKQPLGRNGGKKNIVRIHANIRKNVNNFKTHSYKVKAPVSDNINYRSPSKIREEFQQGLSHLSSSKKISVKIINEFSKTKEYWKILNQKNRQPNSATAVKKTADQTVKKRPKPIIMKDINGLTRTVALKEVENRVKIYTPYDELTGSYYGRRYVINKDGLLEQIPIKIGKRFFLLNTVGLSGIGNPVRRLWDSADSRTISLQSMIRSYFSERNEVIKRKLNLKNSQSADDLLKNYNIDDNRRDNNEESFISLIKPEPGSDSNSLSGPKAPEWAKPYIDPNTIERVETLRDDDRFIALRYKKNEKMFVYPTGTIYPDINPSFLVKAYRYPPYNKRNFHTILHEYREKYGEDALNLFKTDKNWYLRIRNDIFFGDFSDPLNYRFKKTQKIIDSDKSELIIRTYGNTDSKAILFPESSPVQLQAPKLDRKAYEESFSLLSEPQKLAIKKWIFIDNAEDSASSHDRLSPTLYSDAKELDQALLSGQELTGDLKNLYDHLMSIFNTGKLPRPNGEFLRLDEYRSSTENPWLQHKIYVGDIVTNSRGFLKVSAKNSYAAEKISSFGSNADAGSFTIYKFLKKPGNRPIPLVRYQTSSQSPEEVEYLFKPDCYFKVVGISTLHPQSGTSYNKKQLPSRYRSGVILEPLGMNDFSFEDIKNAKNIYTGNPDK